VKGVFGEKLRTPDLNQQPVLGIKEIPRTGSCELVESHHCLQLMIYIRVLIKQLPVCKTKVKKQGHTYSSCFTANLSIQLYLLE